MAQQSSMSFVNSMNFVRTTNGGPSEGSHVVKEVFLRLMGTVA